METGFPLVMLALPLIAALLARVLGRWPRVAAGLGTAALLILALLLWASSPAASNGLLGNAATAFGRPLVLAPHVRGLFLFIYPALALLFILTWFRPVARALVPAALAMLSPLAAGLMIAPPGLGAALLLLAVALLLPALNAGRFEVAGAGWRYFMMVALGLAPLIFVVWLQTSGGTAALDAALLLAALPLVGGFPFHIWVRPLARHAAPAALPLTLGLAQAGLVIFLLGALDGAPAARAAVEFQTAVRASAVLTALLAAFLMAREREWRELVAGAILLDGGLLLAAGLAPGTAGVAMALAAFISRTLSLLLIVAGLGLPPDGAGGPRLRSALLTYGALSLVGLPLTPGFAARWAQAAMLVSPMSGAAAVAVAVALALGGWAVARAARPGAQAAWAPAAAETVPAAGRGERLAAWCLLGLALLLGLFPGLLTAFSARLAGA